MGIIDYTLEPHSDIAFIDMKSFYASVECVERGLNPLTTSLCVMSRADNCNGLILASSPVFKEVFGKNNVGRSYDLPFNINDRSFSYYNARRFGMKITPEYIRHVESWAKKTLIVPPRMNLYIEKNIQILNVLKNYVPDEDIHPYSIDEGFIDLTQSLNYFVKDSTKSRREKLDIICAKIQRDIWKKTGVFSTIGMSNANPDILKKEFGIIGVQLWFHANGVDESKPSVPYKPKSKGLGNSQVLPKDYTIKSQIELVLSEMAEQVAIRLRRAKKKAKSVHITISYSRIEEKRPLVASQKIKPTQNTKELTDYVLALFRKKYTGGAVRSIAVRYDNLVDDNITIISLFDDIEAIEKQEKIDKTLDSIRDKYGFLAVQNGSILMEGSRVKERSKLVGGHAGGMDGIS